MLLCEVIVQLGYAESTIRSNLLMRVPAVREVLSLARQLPTDCLIFKRICLGDLRHYTPGYG
jgi:hypothetical protein